MRQVLATSLMIFMLACGGAKPRTQAGPPLTEEQQKAFDHGVDFVASLEGLEGRWRDDWERDLATRVSTADLIAIVTVGTLRTYTDLEQRVSYKLLVEVEREIIGEPEDKELQLTVSPDDPGFGTIRDNLERLVDESGRFDESYVAYVKRGPDGPHWHLALATEQVVSETESKITLLNRAPKKASTERVIVHTR